VESGRRAAGAIDPRVPLLPQYNPLFLQVTGRLDDCLYAVGLPHILDCAGLMLVLAATLGLTQFVRSF
jgi:hypothetical protein